MEKGDEMKKRGIKQIVSGVHTQDGAGVKLIRVIGHANTGAFDPFLMLDAFDSENPEDYIKGFPWHPHRGIETVTYLIEGEIEHGDSIGNKGTISSGSCQWMTAGKGIMHQEKPQATPKMKGIQLWLNLPAKEKLVEAKYRDIFSKDIPEIVEAGIKVRLLSGTYKNIEGALSPDYVKMTFMDISMEPNQTLEMEIKEKDNCFLYIISGEGNIAGGQFSSIREKQAILLSAGNFLNLLTKNQSMRLLLFAGEPLNEPIAWGGPIVMNTQEELLKAFKDLEKGTFL